MELIPASERARAADAWHELETEETPLACSWSWTDTWLNCYGDMVPHEFAIAPSGVALITRAHARSSGIPLRTLHLGTAGEPQSQGIYVQRNALLTRAGAEQTFLAQLLESLGNMPDFDELRLDGFDEQWGRRFANERKMKLRAQVLASPTVDLRAAREKNRDAITLLSSNTRYQVRRSLRGYGEVETEWAQDVPTALAIFDELVGLHEHRWKGAGESGAFAHECQRTFHHALITRLIPQSRVLLFRVKNAEGTIGCLYSHIDGDSALSYQLGLVPSADNKLKPGFVAHALCMQECLERGIDIYDFLSGGGSYKSELSTGARELHWGRAMSHGPRCTLAAVAAKLRGRA